MFYVIFYSKHNFIPTKILLFATEKNLKKNQLKIWIVSSIFAQIEECFRRKSKNARSLKCSRFIFLPLIRISFVPYLEG
jgi:hypothetical protein